MGLITEVHKAGFFEWGEYIQPTEFCRKNCESKKCSEFYELLKHKPVENFYRCPYGLSAYISKEGHIFTCMRERSTYDKTVSKQIQLANDKTYNPVLDKKQLIPLINFTIANKVEAKKLMEKRAEIDSISHEVKQLNAQIKDKSDIILQSYELNEDEAFLSIEDIQGLKDNIRGIYVSSSMIASRFAMYDYEKQPHLLSQGAAFNCDVYRKFDKIKKILKNYLHRGIVINLKGSTYMKITAFPSFELIPLLLVENAVKYSHSSSNCVDVEFKEISETELVVTISSYSPYCSADEEELIFHKGYRGKNAEKTSDGSGIGLYFVKLLCDLHNIEVKASSDKNQITAISGTAYAPFKTTLKFHNAFK